MGFKRQSSNRADAVIVKVLIDGSKWSTTRKVNDRATGTWTTYSVRCSPRSDPACCMFSPTTLNSGGRSMLDLLPLDSARYEPGTTVEARKAAAGTLAE